MSKRHFHIRSDAVEKQQKKQQQQQQKKKKKKKNKNKMFKELECRVCACVQVVNYENESV